MLNIYIFYSNYGFFFLIFNIMTYIYMSFSLFLLLFSVDFKVSNLSNFFFFYINNFYLLSLITILFSMAGIPPFLGFFGKFIIVIYLVKTFNFFLLLLLIVINFFVIYFYIQNFKFFIKKDLKNLSFSFFFLLFLLVFSFFNFFSFFTINDIYYYIISKVLF